MRLNTRRGLLSGPVRRGERAKMHCFRLATADRPHSSLKETIAFYREKREIKIVFVCSYTGMQNISLLLKSGIGLY